MKTDPSERQTVASFDICKEIEISAPIDIAFEAMLDLKQARVSDLFSSYF